MIYQRKVLALIPARGGSKGIKDKNIYPVCGKPLIAYSIEAAKESRYIDKILVSTDSLDIAAAAAKYGIDIPFLRPQELAQDHSKSIDAVLHALRWLKSKKEFYDILVLLQPTQPLRTAEDIDQSLEKFLYSQEKPLASVSKVHDHPLLLRSMGKDGLLKRFLPSQSTVRRQDMPVYYRVNGCIYINKIDEITEETSFNDNRVPFVMPGERSVDIDDLSDIALAEYYIKNQGGTR